MRWIAGIDEVGAGALAGPIVVAAVAFPVPREQSLENWWPIEVQDSKKYKSHKARLSARDSIVDFLLEVGGEIGISVAHAEAMNELDHQSVYMQAMADAASEVTVQKSIFPETLIVDGIQRITYPYNQRTEKKADARFAHVAMASVIAKTTRDEFMISLAKRYSHYGWDSNMGYFTDQHITALMQHGHTRWHRRKACLTAKRNYRRRTKYG